MTKIADKEAIGRLLAGASSVTVEKRYIHKDETHRLGAANALPFAFGKRRGTAIYWRC